MALQVLDKAASQSCQMIYDDMLSSLSLGRPAYGLPYGFFV